MILCVWLTCCNKSQDRLSFIALPVHAFILLHVYVCVYLCATALLPWHVPPPLHPQFLEADPRSEGRELIRSSTDAICQSPLEGSPSLCSPLLSYLNKQDAFTYWHTGGGHNNRNTLYIRSALGQHNKLHDANKPMKIITLLCFCGGLRETAIYGFDFLTLICCGAKTGCKVLSPQTTVHSTTAQI